MKRSPHAALSLLIALFAITPFAQADKGLVQIVTEPGDAKVFVDGKRKGSTPSEPGLTFAVALDAGEHLVEVTIPAAEPMERYASKEIFVADDTVQSVSLKLTSKRSNITQAFRDRLKKRFPNPIEPEMVAIPAGSFMMGCLKGDTKCRDREKPAHEVQLSAFEMGQYEVTFDEWDACVAHGGCDHWPKDEGWGRGQRPVINVSWEDAQEYITWLNQVTDEHYRLPTEAEWEYAARAGATTVYHWGNTIGRNKANCNGCGSQWDAKQTAPVGRFKANPWGLYDVHGNVWEWCGDWYGEDYYGQSPTVNPKGSASGKGRVLRGGSWGHYPEGLRAADRYGYLPVNRLNFIGFRLSRSAPRP